MSKILDLRKEAMSDSDEEKIPDIEASQIIENVYNSMAKIIEVLNADNVIINKQINQIKVELNSVLAAVASMKSENQDIVNAYTAEINSILENIQKITNNENTEEIKKEFNNLNELINKLNSEMDNIKKKQLDLPNVQKQILDTRTLLLQTINTNMKNIRKEIPDANNIKNIIRPVVVECVNEAVERKLADFTKEQRLMMSQYMRKNRPSTNNMDDYEIMKREQTEFIQKIESIIKDFYEKFGKGF